MVLDGRLVMQAETVELLSKKGKFSTEQALVLAEAMDKSISEAQLVTVPILDARINGVEAKLGARIDALEAKINAKFEL